MNIINLLEGVIKVPEQTVQDAMAIVCGDICSRIYNYLDAPGMDEYIDNQDQLMRIVPKLQKKYGKFDFIEIENYKTHITNNKVYIRPQELDPRYKRTNINKSVGFNIEIHFSDGEDYSGALYYRGDNIYRTQLIKLLLPGRQIELVAKSLELLPALLTEVEGAIRHELMHGIQYIALNTFKHSTSSQYMDGEKVKDLSKYVTDVVEFEPLITSAYYQFNSIIKRTQNSTKLSKNDILQIARKFIGASATATLDNGAVIRDHLFNNFMLELKKVDSTKWKKAVKIFYGLLKNGDLLKD